MISNSLFPFRSLIIYSNSGTSEHPSPNSSFWSYGASQHLESYAAWPTYPVLKSRWRRRAPIAGWLWRHPAANAAGNTVQQTDGSSAYWRFRIAGPSMELAGGIQVFLLVFTFTAHCLLLSFLSAAPNPKSRMHDNYIRAYTGRLVHYQLQIPSLCISPVMKTIEEFKSIYWRTSTYLQHSRRHPPRMATEPVALFLTYSRIVKQTHPAWNNIQPRFWEQRNSQGIINGCNYCHPWRGSPAVLQIALCFAFFKRHSELSHWLRWWWATPRISAKKFEVYEPAHVSLYVRGHSCKAWGGELLTRKAEAGNAAGKSRQTESNPASKVYEWPCDSWTSSEPLNRRPVYLPIGVVINNVVGMPSLSAINWRLSSAYESWIAWSACKWVQGNKFWYHSQDRFWQMLVIHVIPWWSELHMQVCCCQQHSRALHDCHLLDRPLETGSKFYLCSSGGARSHQQPMLNSRARFQFHIALTISPLWVLEAQDTIFNTP